jgi:hypothetical protein
VRILYSFYGTKNITKPVKLFLIISFIIDKHSFSLLLIKKSKFTIIYFISIYCFLLLIKRDIYNKNIVYYYILYTIM